MVILKTLVGNLSANVNEITFTDNIIDGNSIIEVYYNSNDIYTVETWQREHTIGIVTSDHDFPVSVKVLINNVVAFEPYDDSQVLSQLSDLDGRVDQEEDDISGLTTRVGSAEDDIDALETAMTGKQDVLTAGENITIENNVISASGGAGENYSDEEIIVGTITLNGVTQNVYRKMIAFGNLPNATTKTVPHGITNLKQVLRIDCIGDMSISAMPNFNFPAFYDSYTTYTNNIKVDSTNVMFRTYNNASWQKIPYIILTYYKTQD